MKKKKKQKSKQELLPLWYEELILDLKKMVFEELLKTKWKLGERICKEKSKPEYGEETIKNIAKDLNISFQEIYRWKQFYEKFPDFRRVDESWNWEYIKRNMGNNTTRRFLSFCC